MKKSQGIYMTMWAVTAVAFTTIALLIPESFLKVGRTDTSFWISFAFIVVAFVGQLISSMICLGQRTKEDLFLNMPVLVLSYVVLAATAVVEIGCLVLPTVPIWVGTIGGIVLMLVMVVGTVATKATVNQIGNVDKKIKEETSFMKNLVIEADLLKGKASSVDTQEIVKKVSDAIRYSDVRSTAALDEVEGRLYVAFTAFSESLTDEENCKQKADEFLRILQERNARCKMSK